MFGIVKDLNKVVHAVLNNSNLGATLSSVLGQASSAFKPGTMQALSGIVGQATQNTERLLYIAALQAAIAKANAPGLFNVETQINDLWIRLDGVRQNRAKIGQFAEMVSKEQSALSEISQKLQVLSKLSQTAIQNLK